jgi:hypothetical protein
MIKRRPIGVSTIARSGIERVLDKKNKESDRQRTNRGKVTKLPQETVHLKVTAQPPPHKKVKGARAKRFVAPQHST